MCEKRIIKRQRQRRVHRDRRQREKSEAERFLRTGIVERGSGAGVQKRFRESAENGSKRSRLIPVSG